MIIFKRASPVYIYIYCTWTFCLGSSEPETFINRWRLKNPIDMSASIGIVIFMKFQNLMVWPIFGLTNFVPALTTTGGIWMKGILNLRCSQTSNSLWSWWYIYFSRAKVVDSFKYGAGLTGIILCMCPANERRYNVTLSLIGWTYS